MPIYNGDASSWNPHPKFPLVVLCPTCFPGPQTSTLLGMVCPYHGPPRLVLPTSQNSTRPMLPPLRLDAARTAPPPIQSTTTVFWGSGDHASHQPIRLLTSTASSSTVSSSPSSSSSGSGVSPADLEAALRRIRTPIRSVAEPRDEAFCDVCNDKYCFDPGNDPLLCSKCSTRFPNWKKNTRPNNIE